MFLNIAKPVGWLTCFVFAIISWQKYFDMKHTYAKRKYELECNNCVVIYSQRIGITGWPGYKYKCYQVTANDIQRAYEPISQFIDTATQSIDIAIMLIRSSILLNSLLSAVNRGVKVSLILDSNMMDDTGIRNLLSKGVQIQFFFETDSKISSIFHYKYAIKDYNTQNQTVYCGSLNWTDGGFLSSYEDAVFTSNSKVVQEFHKNFVDTSNYLQTLMLNPYVQMQLKNMYNYKINN